MVVLEPHPDLLLAGEGRRASFFLHCPVRPSISLVLIAHFYMSRSYFTTSISCFAVSGSCAGWGAFSVDFDCGGRLLGD